MVLNYFWIRVKKKLGGFYSTLRVKPLSILLDIFWGEAKMNKSGFPEIE